MVSELILVDKNDVIIGYNEKINVHKKGLLHRAFSIFIYDEKNQKILLQKRANKKYHSGGKWSNSCCSHPYKEETWEEAIQRCILDELGIDIKIKSILTKQDNTFSFKDNLLKNTTMLYINKFRYFSDYGEMKENEIDYVYLWCQEEAVLSKININVNEISEAKWINIKELNDWILSKPEDFSSWFQDAYNMILKVIK